MPIFEYRCQGCGHPFEVFLQSGETPECPACHGKKLDKQLSVFAVGQSGGSVSPQGFAGPCGSCGDPRGPGSCGLN